MFCRNEIKDKMRACRGNSVPAALAALQPRPLDTKPNRIFFVSAKFQQRRQNTNFNYNLYDDDDEDDVQVTTLSTESEESSRLYSGGEQQQEVPSGSDILRALQRATVRKHNNSKKRRKQQQQQQQLRAVPESSSTSSIGDAAVKPLRIQSDWSTRLDQLQLRLQELMHS